MFFQLGIVVWQYFKVKSEISIKNEKMFFAEKRVLRERFKVALEEIGKEKIILKFFSSISIFFV